MMAACAHFVKNYLANAPLSIRTQEVCNERNTTIIGFDKYAISLLIVLNPNFGALLVN